MIVLMLVCPPDATLNAVVLSQPSGSMCLCCQEYVTSSVRHRHTTPPAMTQSEDEADGTAVDINYYVCMVHHAKTLHGCAAGLPRYLVAGKRIIFQWFGDYLVATMPGVFCHLLNVSLDFEPCHHILLHNQDIPTMSKPPVPGSGDDQTAPGVTTTSKPSSTPSSTDTSDPTPTTLTMLDKSKTPGEDSQTVDSEPTNEGVGGSGRSEDHPDSSGGSSDPAQVAIPAPGSVQGVGSPGPSPLSGHGASPKAGGGGGELPDALSVIDVESFQLSAPMVPCFGFYREAGSLGELVYRGGGIFGGF
ncbi:hypothetical protein ACOMHN_067321 [Nucella lapillus]